MSQMPVDRLKDMIDKLPAVCGADLRMQDLTDAVLAALRALLYDRDSWKSVYIDYEPPYLMRIALPLCGTTDDRRIHIALHYFFGRPGTGAADAYGLVNPYVQSPEDVNRESVNNYHPHPWAAAFHLFEGSYDQRIGRAQTIGYSNDPASPLRPPVIDIWRQDSTLADKARYAFNDKLIWHQVLPNDGAPVTSLMITYIPADWDQIGPRPPQQQRPLHAQERAFMFAHFTQLVTPRPQTQPTARPASGMKP